MAIISVVMASLLLGIAAEKIVEKPLPAESDSPNAELLEWELPSRLKTVMPYYVAGYDYEDRPVIVMETGRWYTRLIVEKHGEDVQQLEKSIDQFVERVLVGYFRDQRNHSNTQTDDDEFVAILDFDGYNFQELNSPANLKFNLKNWIKLEKCYKKFAYGFVVNANTMAQHFLLLSKPFMGNFLENVEVFGTLQSKWIPEILKKIPTTELPPKYGGVKNVSFQTAL